MCNVPTQFWVPLATINFHGTAELWLQTYEAQHTIDSWPELCVVVEQKFGRDLYQNYMRDLLGIRQTGDVLEYAARFDQAKHRVLVHNQNINEVCFVQKFLDGLKYNISNALALHRPRTVDAALSLALMQEEMLEASTKRFSARQRNSNRSSFSSAGSQQHTNVVPTAGLLGSPPISDKSLHKHKYDDKLSALRAARRAKDLCMKCGEITAPNTDVPSKYQFMSSKK